MFRANACIGLLTAVLALVSHGAAGAEEASRPFVRVVYFIPTDRKPEPDHIARLDRVMTEVQRFYRVGMQQNGHGPLTFELERDANGALRVHEVAAKQPMKSYGRNSSGPVRQEVKEALAKKGINIDRETIIIFQLLLEWRGDRATEIGSYVGGGNAHSGTAWVYDDAKLDPKLLSSKQPGGYYNGPCSIGQFNTHYIGGVAHELGHALGLPHERERDQDRPRKGLSLMGGGNHTYGQEQRGEGKGSFLTPAAAYPLSLHPLFTGKRTVATAMTCRIARLTPSVEKGDLVLAGQFEGGPRVVGLVAYNDPAAVPGDYDSLAWTCPVDAAGMFRVVIGDLRPGEHELRLRAYGASGDFKTLRFKYQIDTNRQPDLRPFSESK